MTGPPSRRLAFALPVLRDQETCRLVVEGAPGERVELLVSAVEPPGRAGSAPAPGDPSAAPGRLLLPVLALGRVPADGSPLVHELLLARLRETGHRGTFRLQARFVGPGGASAWSAARGLRFSDRDDDPPRSAAARQAT